jgi:taurine dioxygenase
MSASVSTPRFPHLALLPPIECLEPLDARAAALGFELEHLAPALGSVVHGPDLRALPDSSTRDFLRDLLVERKVIFFRNQEISPTQHIAFSRLFGELEIHPFAKNHPDYPEVLVLHSNRDEPPVSTDVWHSDVTWRPKPSLGSLLLAREVPSTGGDTCWANMEAAYEGLDDETKQLLEGKMALHDSHLFRAGMRARGASDDEVAEYQREHPAVHHPVIRTHPDSGRKSIYVNALFTVRIEGVPEETSARLLRELEATANRLEYQCRFHWRAGSMAFWDNRAAQHYAVSDYWPATRLMERVTVVGEKPV